MGDLAVLDMASRFAHLKPPHGVDRLRGSSEGLLNGVFYAARGGSNYFDRLVHVVAHCVLCEWWAGPNDLGLCDTQPGCQPPQRRPLALAVVLGCTVAFLGGAIYAYNPSKGLIARRGGPGGAG